MMCVSSALQSYTYLSFHAFFFMCFYFSFASVSSIALNAAGIAAVAIFNSSKFLAFSMRI